MRSPHADSAPLWALLSGADGKSASEASHSLHLGLSRLRLHEDLSAIITFENGDTSVELEARSEYGARVLDELSQRSTLPACPEGECQKGASGECVWCGQG